MVYLREEVKKIKSSGDSNNLNQLKNIIEEQKVMIINLQENLQNLNHSLKKKDEEIKKINDEYSIKEKKIIDDYNKLFQKINNVNYRYNIRAVLFMTSDQSIIHAIPCLASDNFAYVLNILFRDCPQLNDRKKYTFLKGGRIINDSDIIDKYKIGDGYQVTILRNDSLNSSRISLNSFK